MRNADAHRIALLRDLLMDYPSEPTDNHGPPPAGLTPDEEDAWAQEQFDRQAPQLPLEGRYDGDMGRPDATMVAPGQSAWQAVQEMRERLNPLMPKAGQIAPIPDDPEAAPTRAQALARMLRRG